MRSARGQALLALVVLGLAAWAVHAGQGSHLPAWLEGYLEQARNFYGESPVTAVLIFCALHLFSSMFSVPGSCTALNITSGAVFGFRRGCAIVYPVTLLGGCLGWWCATWLRETRMMRRYGTSFDLLREKIEGGGFLALVTLRLSPFLPYGVLNPALGLLGVPFGAFLASTFVGIFLDVVLLNSIGSALSSTGEPGLEGWKLLLCFAVLAAVTWGARRLARWSQEDRR